MVLELFCGGVGQLGDITKKKFDQNFTKEKSCLIGVIKTSEKYSRKFYGVINPLEK